MSKTWRRVLPALAIAPSLLIGQAAFFGQSSPVSAAVGPAITVQPSTSSTGTGGQLVTITATGFTPNTKLDITFNAPYGTGNGQHAPTASSTTINNPTPANQFNGDNSENGPIFGGPNGTGGGPIAGPPPAGPSAQLNTIEVQTTTDSNGNVVSSSNPVQLFIPSTAVTGTYRVFAIDESATSPAPDAATTFTVVQAGIPQLVATPVLPSAFNSAAIGGVLSLTAPPSTFTGGDVIHFTLDDFVASNGAGKSFQAPSEPGPNAATGTSAASFNALPAADSVSLKVVGCGTLAPSAGGPTVSAPQATCKAGVDGSLQAQVQLLSSSAMPITSRHFLDQVYSIDASNTGSKTVTAGFHLDHTLTNISLSSNISSVGGSVTVRGIGFGANSAIELFFGGQVTQPNPILVAAGANPPAGFTGCYFVSAANSQVPNGAYIDAAPVAGSNAASANCRITPSSGITADPSGSFQATVTFPANAAVNAGSILAVDYDGGAQAADGTPSRFLDNRLNEGATAPIALGSAPAPNNVLKLTTVPASSPATAAVGETVTFAGAGYQPYENVTVTLTNPNPAPIAPPAVGAAAPTCTPSTVFSGTADGTGNITGSFVVPANCNTLVPINSAALSPTGACQTYTVGGVTSTPVCNNGATVTLTATGGQTGLAESNNLVIPKTTASITNAAGGLLQLTGTGFAANEPVTFQFGIQNFFVGNNNVQQSVSAVADSTGAVTVTAAPSVTGQSGVYNVTATGLNSGFTATAQQPVNFNGVLNCPTGAVIPGQVLVISGTGFTNAGPGSLFNNGTTNGTLNVTFPNNTFNSGNGPVGILISSTGTFSSTITVPQGTPAGTYTLTVTAAVPGVSTVQQRTCTITVVATTGVVNIGTAPTFGVTSAQIGSTVPVSITGFAGNEPITVALTYADGSPLSGTAVPGTAVTVTADANGNALVSFPVKSTVNALTPGTFNLSVSGANSGLIRRVPFVVLPAGGTPGVTPQTALYFAEGFTGQVSGGSNANFNETLSILNANNFTTTYTVTYFLEGASGATSTQVITTGTIGANSVIERSVNTDVGNNQKVAAEISSPAPIAASRLISRTNAAGTMLDQSSSLGQQLNLTGTAPTGGYNYYFASGEIQLTNEEYVTLLNPGATASSATITILPQSVISATTPVSVAPITVSVPANSRLTVPIRALLVKANAGVNQFGMAVNSNVPLAVERAEYYGDGIGSAKYGAATKPASQAPFRQYIFAANSGTFPSTGGNNAIGTGNDISEVDVINPGPASAGSATVTVSFFAADGTPINSQQVQVDGGTRETIAVNDVVSTQSNVFSVVVTSDRNVVVEKPTYFGGNPINGGMFAVSNPSGAPAGLTSVAFPYLDLADASGAPISQTVYLYNPGATPITVRGIFASTSSVAPVVKTYTVASNSITVVSVNTDAAPLKSPLGAIFTIVPGAGTSDAFVALAQANTPNFKSVVSNQGTYPIAASTGF